MCVRGGGKVIVGVSLEEIFEKNNKMFTLEGTRRFLFHCLLNVFW